MKLHVGEAVGTFATCFLFNPVKNYETFFPFLQTDFPSTATFANWKSRPVRTPSLQPIVIVSLLFDHTDDVNRTFKMIFLIDWLIDWLIDCTWLIDWLTAWLIDCLFDWLLDWLIDRTSCFLHIFFDHRFPRWQPPGPTRPWWRGRCNSFQQWILQSHRRRQAPGLVSYRSPIPEHPNPLRLGFFSSLLHHVWIIFISMYVYSIVFLGISDIRHRQHIQFTTGSEGFRIRYFIPSVDVQHWPYHGGGIFLNFLHGPNLSYFNEFCKSSPSDC